MIATRALAALSASATPSARPEGIRRLLAISIFAAFVVMGEVAWVDQHPVITVLSAGVAASLLFYYVIAAPMRADSVDRGVLISVVLFAFASVFSVFPRQSLDSVAACLVYAAGLFLARGILAPQPTRKLFLSALMALSGALTLATALRWLPPFFEWWSATQWSVFPPLGMTLHSQPYGHRHDLALVLVMLYPAWWMGQVSRTRAAAAAVIGALTAVLVVIGGSRSVWLAAAGATVIVVGPLLLDRFATRRPRVGLVLVGGAVLTAVVGSATGVAGAFIERLLGGGTVASRLAMWGPLTEAWWDRPLTGYGPGSFPWILQRTDYFDTNSFAPRHPDNAVIQLLAEGGIIGVAALIVLLAALIPSLFRGRSHAGTWAVLAFGLAALGGNPTDFRFVVVLAIGWTAFALPRDESVEQWRMSFSVRPIRILSLALAIVIAVVFAASMVAYFAYSSARSAVADGELMEAVGPLEIAATLDPGLAIYRRQLGSVLLLVGNDDAAIEELERATSINPSDDLAWRTLALAYAETGNAVAWRTALERALGAQRSDATNLLLAARGFSHSGDDDGALRALAEVAQAWPMIVAAPGWSDLGTPIASTTEVLGLARARWATGTSSPEPLAVQPLLLGVMTGREALWPSLASPSLSETLASAYVAVMRCDEDARSLLRDATGGDLRHSTYWVLTLRQSQLDGEPAERWTHMIAIMTGDTRLFDPLVTYLNPLHENGIAGFGSDAWGYRRSPFPWGPTEWDLPSPRTGFARWHLEPRSSAYAAGLSTALPQCISSEVSHDAPS